MFSRPIALLATAAAAVALQFAPTSDALAAVAPTVPESSNHTAAGDSPSVRAALAELRAEYATTHLRSVHSAIVLILNVPSSAVV